MRRAARSLVALLPLLNVACAYSYTGFAVPEGMKTAVFAGGTASVREWCVRSASPWCMPRHGGAQTCSLTPNGRCCIASADRLLLVHGGGI